MSKIAKPLETFWNIDSNDCWIWRGQINNCGYGKYKKGERTYIAHRYVFEIYNKRKIITGLDLDHLCHVRLCVNPAHLEEVTRKENIRRMDAYNAKRSNRF